MNRKDSTKGFTIVEVALVLALAGLIFLMVFIALPAVQRTQRDSQRRDDVGKLLTAIAKFQTNNRGALPSGGEGTEITASSTNGWGEFYKAYLGSDFADPNGSGYKLWIQDCSGRAGEKCSGSVAGVEKLTSPDHKIYVVKGATCDGSTAISSDNLRKVAAVYKMEGAGAYCASTQ